MSAINYIPNIHILSFGVSDGPQGAGAGSPEGVATGYPGYSWTNTSNGDLYVFNGTPGDNTGWVLVTGGGGGGSGATFAGTGTPEGHQVGSPGNTYTQTDTGSFWVKLTGSATNSGWLEIVQ